MNTTYPYLRTCTSSTGYKPGVTENPTIPSHRWGSPFLWYIAYRVSSTGFELILFINPISALHFCYIPAAYFAHLPHAYGFCRFLLPWCVEVATGGDVPDI